MADISGTIVEKDLAFELGDGRIEIPAKGKLGGDSRKLSLAR
jgi:hypothetical protein